MRITRSTLRRLIAEESARLLREAAFPEEIEAQYGRGREGEEEYEEDGPGSMFDYEPGEDDVPYSAADYALMQGRGTRMLHVTYHGGEYEGGEGFSNIHFIVTDFQANPFGEEAEDVTAEITGGEDLDALETAYALKDWLLSHTEVGYVDDEEMHDPETDDNSTVDEYIDHLDGLIASQEEEAGERGAEMYGRAVDRGDYGDLDEADAATSPLAAAEGRLRAAIKDIHPTKASSLTTRVLDLIDDVMMEEAIAAVADGSREFPFNASVKVLEQMGDTFPGDADLEELHAAIDAVIKPQWRGALESAKDAEEYGRDIEDTERDLSRPSRFLQESDDDSQGEEEEDTGYFDQTDWSAAEVRAGRHAEGPYGGMDSDTPEYHARLRRSPDDLGRGRMAALAARGIRFRHGGEDVDMEPVDSDYAGDNLSESIDMMSAGIGAVVGIASLYAAGGLASIAKQVLNALSDRQQEAALDAAHRKAQSKMAAAVEALSEDEHLISLFKQLRSIQRSKRDGMARDFTEKTQEINEYIRSKSEELDFGGMDAQDMRSAVSKRIKKGEGKKGDSKSDEKLDEARWAKLAGILKG